MSTLIQISDPHLFSKTKQEKKGICPYANLMQMLTAVQNHQPDLLVVSGDLVDDITEEAYQHVAKALKPLSCPVLWTLGNHDEPQLAKRILSQHGLPWTTHLEQSPWLIIHVNSHWPNHIGGQLTSAELNQLQDTLQYFPQHPTLIVLHHPPLPIHHHAFDQIMLSNAQALHDIVDQHPQIKIIAFGHIHQAFEQTRKHIRYLGCPSSAHQMKAQEKSFIRENIAPGFRIFRLNDDGTFKTHIERIKTHIS
jgi:Icc protein